MAVLPSPGVRVAVVESLINDLGRVSEWCDLCGMKLNASKTKTMIVSRSHTIHPQSPTLTIDGTVLKASDDLVLLGVTFDAKMTFDKHLSSVSRAASQRLGILRKSWRVFHDRSHLEKCFRGFVLPVLEHCSVVWCSAADTHLKLLDCTVSGARFLTGGVFECDIAHRRSVASCVSLLRSDVTRCIFLMVLYLDHMCQCGYTWCSSSTSVHLCTASLQNLAVQQDFYSHLGVRLELSWVSRAEPMLFHVHKLL